MLGKRSAVGKKKINQGIYEESLRINRFLGLRHCAGLGNNNAIILPRHHKTMDDCSFGAVVVLQTVYHCELRVFRIHKGRFAQASTVQKPATNASGAAKSIPRTTFARISTMAEHQATPQNESRLLTMYTPEGEEVEVNIKYVMDMFPNAVLDLHALEEHICPCCYVEYGKVSKEGDEAERPLKTLCNHIFGHKCLEQWLPNNTCPTCRRRLFHGPINQQVGRGVDVDATRILIMAIGDDEVWLDRRRIRTMAELEAHRTPLGARARALVNNGTDGTGYTPDSPVHWTAAETEEPRRAIQRRLMFDSEGGQIIFEAPARALTDSETRGPEDGASTAENLVERDMDQQPSLPDRSGSEDRIWLVGEIRRVGARREWRLYRELQAAGVVLPGPRWFGPDLGGTLDWRQDRALFQEIRRRGGFEYSGMRQRYGSDNPLNVADALAYQELRDSGACWGVDETWTLCDGTVVWGLLGDGINQRDHRAGVESNDGTGTGPEQDGARDNDEVGFNELARVIETWEI